MDTRGAAAKVGLMVILGAALFGAAWWFLSHGLYKVSHYRIYAIFKDTKGLLKQTPVRMNGVAIGEVEDIKLLSELNAEDRTHFPPEIVNDPSRQLQPVVFMAILKEHNRIPIDSKISITSGLLISNPQVEIIPGSAPQRFADGSAWPENGVVEPQSLLASMSPEADKTLKSLNKVLVEMTPEMQKSMLRIRGILNRTETTMANFEAASASVRQLAADPSIRRTLRVTMADLQGVSHEVLRTSQEMSLRLRQTVDRTQPKLDKLADTLLESAQHFTEILEQSRSTLARLTDQLTDPRLHQSLLETIDLANSTIARFNQIATDIHQLTGDPAIQNDLKTMVSTGKDAATKIDVLADKVGQLVGGIKTGKKPNLGIGRPEFGIDFISRTNSPYFRSDLSMRVPIGEHNAFNLGIYDFAERYKLNAQYETDINGLGALRYGVYASKLGAGFNTATKGPRLSIDAYDPNNPKLDVRGYTDLSRDFALWFGADSLFKKTTPLIGLRLKR